MPITTYPDGFASGIAIRGVPLIQTHPGEVYWVSNNTTLLRGEAAGSNNNPGTFQRPFATIAYALTKCKANKGDIIFVKPGHAETVPNAITLALNVAGVAIIGLGKGSNRPTITLNTAAAATIIVSAANITMSNFIITANFADIVSAFSVNAAKDFHLHKCDILATAANMNFLHVIDTSTTDNAQDGLTVTECFWYEPDAATLAFALVDSSNARWNISDNEVVNGNATADVAAMFTCAAGKILTGARILRNNVSITGNAGSTAGLFLTTNQTTHTGLMAYNNLKHLDATTEIFLTASAGFGLFENRATATAAAQGYLLPAIDA